MATNMQMRLLCVFMLVGGWLLQFHGVAGVTCLDNTLPPNTVGYFKVCWEETTGTNVVLVSMSWVDSELNAWNNDLSNPGFSLFQDNANLLPIIASTAIPYGRMFDYSGTAGFQLKFTILPGNTEMQMEFITTGAWTGAGSVIWAHVQGDINENNPNSKFDDYGVVKRHSPRNNDYSTLIALWDPILNRKISLRVRDVQRASYMGWRVESSAAAPAVPTSTTVSEDGVSSTMQETPLCQWSYGFMKNAATRKTNANPVTIDVAFNNVQPNANIKLMFGVPQEEGDQITVQADFSSMSPHSIQSIDWGDGSSTIQNPVIDETNGHAYATHVYANDGFYVVTMTVVSLSGVPATETTVTNLRILNSAPRVFIGNVEVRNGQLTVDDMQFIDKGTLDTHTSDILWGEGIRRIVPVVETTSPIGSVLGNIGTVKPGAITISNGGGLWVEIRVKDSDCEVGRSGTLVSVGTHTNQFHEMPCFLMYYRYIMSWDKRYKPPAGVSPAPVGTIRMYTAATGIELVKTGIVPLLNVDLSLGVAPPITFARILPGIYYFKVWDESTAIPTLVAQSPTFQLRAQRC